MTSRLRTFRGLLRGTTARAGYASVIDQGLVSGAGFVMNFMLARNLPKEEYGAFVLAYGGLLFAAGLQMALVTQPLNVIGAKLEGIAYQGYLRGTAVTQVALSGVTAVLCAAVAAALWATGHADGAVLTAVLAPAILFWQLQEFARRAQYTRGLVRGALLNDAVAYGLQIVGLAALIVTGRLSGVAMIAVVAVGQAAGAALGAWQLRHELTAAPPRVDEAVESNWRYGRWMLAGTLTQWASEQLYPFLTAGALGLDAPAVLRSLQNVVALSYVLTMAMEVMLLPRAAAAYARGGREELRAFTAKVYAVTAPPVLGFLLIVAVFATPILTFFYGKNYDNYGLMLSSMAFNFGLVYFHRPIAMGLRAMEVTRPTFDAYLWSTIATFTLGLGSIYLFGLWGAIVGGFLNAAILNVVMWRAWRNAQRGSD